MPVNNNPFNNNFLNQPNNSHQIIWVKGYEEAKKYQLPKDSNVVLFDSEIEGRFYIKITDNIGMYNIRFFNFTEVFPNTQQDSNNNNNSYVTYDQLTQLLTSFKDNLIKELKNDEQSLSAVEPAKKYNIITTKQQ